MWQQTEMLRPHGPDHSLAKRLLRRRGENYAVRCLKCYDITLVAARAACARIQITNKTGHGEVDRSRINIAWGGQLLDPAAPHDCNPRRHREGFFLVVRDV